MPSNHLILCRPLLPPSVFPSIRVFSNESVIHIRWPKYWSFSFSTPPPTPPTTHKGSYPLQDHRLITPIIGHLIRKQTKNNKKNKQKKKRRQGPRSLFIELEIQSSIKNLFQDPVDCASLSDGTKVSESFPLSASQ